MKDYFDNIYSALRSPICLLLAACLCLPLSAQKKKTAAAKGKNKAAAVAKSAAEEVDVEKLIFDYQFDKAAAEAQRQLTDARRTGKPATQVENNLRRAQLGATMLQGTEQIVFIDSVVVERRNFLQAMTLTKGNGSVAQLKALVKAGSLLRDAKSEADAGMAYLNDFADRIIFSAADTSYHTILYSAYKDGTSWSEPTRLEGLTESTHDMLDYPFMLPDGVTLYFAADGSESLGGYDIFQTRFSASTGQFLKAENVGMPFNSPANDFLLLIDENTGLGMFATDRNTDAEHVCIYKFIPSETRNVYEADTMSEEALVRFARIANIADTQTDAAIVAAAKQRELTALQSATAAVAAQQIVITDALVLRSLSDFVSPQARQLAKKFTDDGALLETQEAQLDALRQQYGTSHDSRLEPEIKRLEASVIALHASIQDTAKAMRAAELKARQ